MQKINFHTLLLGDCEDPDLYAAGPLLEWQKTEQGQWVMTNCPEPRYAIGPDIGTLGFKVQVYGEVEDKLATEYYLKWQKQS